MKITDEIKISDNGFVFNSKTGDSFNLNPVALALIKLIKEGQNFEEIKSTFLATYDVDDLMFEKDFFELVALLKYHQITVENGYENFV